MRKQIMDQKVAREMEKKRQIEFLIHSVWCFGAQIKNAFGFCLKQNLVVASTPGVEFDRCVEQNFNTASTGPCVRKWLTRGEEDPVLILL